MKLSTDFSEKTKLEVKKKAMFQCCRCRKIGIDVHHIKPQKDGGSDDINNAAPLCQNCHDQFGDNPTKRKEITQMRDNWYEAVERMYSNKVDTLFPLIENVNSTLESVQMGQIRSESNIQDMKTMLKEMSAKAIDNMTAGTATLMASNTVKASLASISNTRIEDIPEIVMCMECDEPVVMADGVVDCPHCGQSMFH